MIRLVLASASPRRAELLRQAGIEFDVMPADVDERVAGDETPEEYVRRVAQSKARTVAGLVPGRLVLGADTTVVLGAELLGKPCDGEDAKRMLGALSGRTHEVLTAVTLADGRTPEQPPELETHIARTAVEFARLSETEIAWYAASGEPMDKAGGYAIQGLASRFVTRITGSYSNVVGLPVALVYGLLRERGALPIPRLW